MKIIENKSRPVIQMGIGVVLVLLSALGIFYLVMRPPLADFKFITYFFSTASFVVILAGFLAFHFGWLRNLPRIRWAVFGTYAISSLITFLTIWLAARLMFASEHDFLLGMILLFFSSGINLILGYYFSQALTQRISSLRNTLREVQGGNLATRALVCGRDEVAELANTFNSFVDQMQTVERKKKELDTLRRDLIAWVGHDLQTPLASIRAIVEALADDMVDDRSTRERYLRTAKRELQELSSLLDDLFELSHLDAGGIKLELQPNSMTDLISDALESFSALSQERGITLNGAIEAEVDPVVMDAKRIGRVIDNLISNALRFTPEGGNVRVLARPAAEGVEVEIRDSGQGFDPDDLPYLFDRFFRGEKSRNRETGGVGLGLAIAKGFVEAHGGHIDAQSIPEGGSSFRFTIPA